MPPTVFISYSHSDARWKDRLVSQLGILQHEGLLTTWHDGLIQAGADWLPVIEAAIAEARIAILIVSAAFLNSEFIRRKEIPALMARREKDGLRLVPLIASPCPWQKVPWLAAIQARPLHGKTLAELGGVRAAKALSELAEEILSVETPSSSAEPLDEDLPVSPTYIVDEIDPLVPTELLEFEDPVVAFDIMPHNRGLVVCHPQEVRILASLSPPTRKDRRLRLEGGEATSCALSADGTLLAVGDSFASVTIYKVRDGTKVKSFQRRPSAKEVKRFSKLGLRENSFEYGELTFSPDGRYLAACRRVAPRDHDRINYPHRIKPMDEPVDIYGIDGEFKYRLPGYGCYPIACFTRDSQHIVIGLERDDDDNFAVYNLENGKMKYSVYLDGFVRCIATHPDGKQVAISLGGDDKRAIRFLSVTSGRERKSFSYHAIPDDGRYPCTDSVCIDTAGHYLASAHNCGVIRLWDVSRHTLMLTWLTNARGLWANKLLFSSDSDYLFASLRDFPADTINTLAVVRMADLLRRVESPNAPAGKGEEKATNSA
jgi:WD40 repeat protein